MTAALDKKIAHAGATLGTLIVLAVVTFVVWAVSDAGLFRCVVIAAGSLVVNDVLSVFMQAWRDRKARR